MRMTASWFWIRIDPPNTRVWRDVPRLMASSPRIITRSLGYAAAQSARNGQQGELIIDNSKNHTRPDERTNRVHVKSVDTKSPIQACPAKAVGRCMDSIFVERLWRSLKYEEVVCCGSLASA
jgi:hypothetical protein